jgi:tryptophan-rich sensory protein
MILGFISGKIGKVDEWYMKKLKKPPLNPPNFIFPIVWSILYLLMGI